MLLMLGYMWSDLYYQRCLRYMVLQTLNELYVKHTQQAQQYRDWLVTELNDNVFIRSLNDEGRWEVRTVSESGT